MKPSIFMPRWASRIALEIVSVRVEKVQNIKKEDAVSEGFPYPLGKTGADPISWFARLWNSLNAKRGYSWALNPWVWVIEFLRLPKPEEK